MDDITFPNCEVIVHGCEIEHHSLDNVSTIFIKIGDSYFYLQEATDKIYDISRMPHYISSDWVNYNKKEITNFIIEKWIAQFSSVGTIDSEYLVSELKLIKRDMKLRKLL